MPSAALLVALTLAVGCAGEVIEGEDLVLNAARQQALESNNGLISVNGRRGRNGLIANALLTLQNGLTTVNGVVSLNGLVTNDGSASTRRGLSIDCAGKTLGTSCTGEPDGLLSADTGLMATDEDIQTAVYTVRCALPSGDSIRVRDYTGGLVTLRGELGLAPSWKRSSCDAACQEKVSACLMALTNGDGANVELELSAPFTLGVGHSPAYPYQEAAFYGNLFVSPAQAFYCVGEDYAELGWRVEYFEMRSCEGYNSDYGDCPYVHTGLCNDVSSRYYVVDKRCSWTGLRGDTAASCADLQGKTWNYPITTFRDVVY